MNERYEMLCENLHPVGESFGLFAAGGEPAGRFGRRQTSSLLRYALRLIRSLRRMG